LFSSKREFFSAKMSVRISIFSVVTLPDWLNTWNNMGQTEFADHSGVDFPNHYQTCDLYSMDIAAGTVIPSVNVAAGTSQGSGNDSH